MRSGSHRYVKAKALAAQSAEIPKDKGSFGVSFSAIFLHEKKDSIPEGRCPLRSGKVVPEQSPVLTCPRITPLSAKLTFPLSGGTYGVRPLAPQNGAPAKPSASGFAGERRRKGVNGAFRPKGGNGVHGLFDDAGECHEVTRGFHGGISNCR